MRPPDYHMHTPLCNHARGEPNEYAVHAIQVGQTEIGFSDHSPMRENDFDDWRMRLDQLDEYVGKVRRAQVDYPNLRIKLALEVDYLPGHEEWIRDLAGRYSWDYFIGSVHYVSDSFAIDNVKMISQWKNRDAYEVWSAYFERLTLAAESRLFEILGHADLPKRFCFYPDRDCTSLFRRLVQAAKDHDVALELNTGGLRKDCREIYPHPSILQLASEAGVPITFGSDAHAPEEVGMNFAEAIQLAQQAGYTHSCYFTQRKRELVRF